MTKQTIWITGANGRLGTELVKRLETNKDYKIIDTDKDVDITEIKEVEQMIDVYRPTIVINCASISDVNYCEEHMVEAFRVNALGARNLATSSRRMNAKIVQMSTDDIFEGHSLTGFTEFDTPNPKTVYGKSKLAGENFVRELNPKHLIIRSSWVYGASSEDYLRYVTEKGKNGEAFQVPADVFSSPTGVTQLADFIEKLMNLAEYGVYHASCEGSCSRFEFAQKILSLQGFDANLVQKKWTGEEGEIISTRLENLMMKMTGIYEMPDWQAALEQFLQNRIN